MTDISVAEAREQLVSSVDRVLGARAAVAAAEDQLRVQLGRAAPAGVAFEVIEAQLGRLAAGPCEAPAATVPPSRAPEDEEDRGALLREDLARQLAGCETKKDALLVLYRRRIGPGDGRSRNAVTEALLAELRAHRITLDRGTANRYVEAFATAAGHSRLPATGAGRSAAR
ncbi:hypothetical protein GCM10009760_61070 [Kitasatospora kazusensis]|uniref:Uncharacterized protein n=1 Tax=Kitasatospora kazusensis TaxID=407974 RepID=A0ABP5M3Y4_9ACTN